MSAVAGRRYAKRFLASVSGLRPALRRLRNNQSFAPCSLDNPPDMLSAYFDFWSRYWHEVAEVSDKRSEPVRWIVELGPVRKSLDEIHSNTGLHRLIEPTKARIEAALNGNSGGLTVVFRIDPARGLMHAFQGPASVVRRAQAVLKST